MKIIIILLVILLTSCNSSRLVNSYKNEQQAPIKVTRLLVIGISPNFDARKGFEYEIQKALIKKNIVTIPSLEYYKDIDLLPNLNENEVAELEKQLLSDQFNAVLLARVVSVENKTNLADNWVNMHNFYKNFKQDYFENQLIQGINDEDQNYKVFHTETALYKISEAEMRGILWRGSIDIVNPENTESSIKKYIKLLIRTFEKENIFDSALN